MKWPRTYAADYLKATTPEQQKAAVAGCPKEYRELVKAHVRMARDRQKSPPRQHGFNSKPQTNG